MSDLNVIDCANRLLDTVHLAFVTHGLYVYMVSNFGNLVALAAPPWFVTCIINDCDKT